MTTVLRRLTKVDVPALLEVTNSIGWDFSPEDLRTIVSVGEVYGHDVDGTVVSSSAIFPYGEVAWLGAVMVRADFQGRGLGTAIVRSSLEQAPSSVKSVLLVATPQGARIYERLGFRIVTRIQRCIAQRGIAGAGSGAVALGPEDIEAVIALDQKHQGMDRSTMLRARIEQGKRGIVVRRGQSAVGYGLRVMRRKTLSVGPIVALDAEMASEILIALGTGWAGPVRVDVPFGHEALVRRGKQMGFEVEDTRPIMALGESRVKWPGQQVYALAAQAFG